MKKVNLLSKAEMKKVAGGTEPISYDVLRCHTPNGTEDWRRTVCLQSNAENECRLIYPAYGTSVWGECVATITPE